MKHVIWLLGLSLLVFNAWANERSPSYIEGVHYAQIKPAAITKAAEGKVEVTELFWYGCPHCFTFEPHLEKWQKTKPENVEFDRIPAVLNPRWESHAKAYYALQTMGELDRMHSIFFKAIHQQRRNLKSLDAMARFFAQHGVDEDKFRKAYNSFEVNVKFNTDKQRARQYGAQSVPTLIVNGKYRTSASMAGGHQEVLKVIDYLIAEETNTFAEQGENKTAEIMLPQ